MNIQAFRDIRTNTGIQDADRITAGENSKPQRSTSGFFGKIFGMIKGSRQEENRNTFTAFKKALETEYGDAGVTALRSIREDTTHGRRLTKADISRVLGLAERLKGRLDDKEGSKKIIEQHITSHQNAEKRSALGGDDAVKGAALDGDLKSVKEDFNAGFRKLLDNMRSEYERGQYKEDLNKSGRDAQIYNTRNRNDSLIETMGKWGSDWPLKDSGGFLADLAYAGNHRGEFFLEKKYTDVVRLPDTASKREKQQARERSVQEGAWKNEVLEGANTKVKMGPSGTTAFALGLITSLNEKYPGNKIKDTEIEAMMNGLATFWDRTLKKATGDFHTPSEVWATYNQYLLDTQPWQKNVQAEEQTKLKNAVLIDSVEHHEAVPVTNLLDRDAQRTKKTDLEPQGLKTIAEEPELEEIAEREEKWEPKGLETITDDPEMEESEQRAEHAEHYMTQLHSLRRGKDDDLTLMTAWAHGDRNKALAVMQKQLGLSDREVESIRDGSAKSNQAILQKLPRLGHAITARDLAPQDKLLAFTNQANKMRKGLGGGSASNKHNEAAADLRGTLEKLKGEIYRDVLEDHLPLERQLNAVNAMHERLKKSWDDLDKATGQVG